MAGVRRCVCVLALLGAWLGVGAAAWAGEPDPALLMVRGSASCGDGLVQADEACDDGNLALGDGCSATCRLELRFTSDADHDGISDADERLLGTRHDAADSDGDGLCDGLDAVPGVCYVGEGATVGQDSDGDGRLDALEADDDHDGIATSVEVALTLSQGRFDPDCDGLPSWADGDSDADGLADGAEGLEDDDGDGLSAFLDTYPSDGPLGDMDGDGLTNAQEAYLGTRPMSPDSDFDGILDGVEAPQGLALDADGDGTPDALDTDSDDDSAPTWPRAPSTATGTSSPTTATSASKATASSAPPKTPSPRAEAHSLGRAFSSSASCPALASRWCFSFHAA